MTQPKALFLADVLERSAQTHTQATAAAELRRLYAELERCKQVCAATSEGWTTDAKKWKERHDALLDALRDATKTIEHLGYPLAAIQRARAAIAKVEENT